MANFKAQKVVSSLPGALEADTVYFVRVGSGFDIYATNSSGTIVAYALNKPTSLDNSNLAASAAIALNKLAAMTPSRSVVTDASGFLVPATATAAQVNALAGRTANRLAFFDASSLLTDTANLIFNNSSGALNLTNANFPYLQLTKSGVANWYFGGNGTTDNQFYVRFNASTPLTLGTGTQVGINSTTPGAQLDTIVNGAALIGLRVKGASGQANYLLSLENSTGVQLRAVSQNGKSIVDATMTANGTTGSATINKPAGSVRFAAAASSLVLTNNQITVNSMLKLSVRGNDANCFAASYTVVNGSATIYAKPAAPAAELEITFEVIN